MLNFFTFAFLVIVCRTDALPAEPFILYSNRTNIRSVDLVSYTQADVLGGQDRVIPLGVDTVNRHVYFGDAVLGRIFRSNYDGSSVTVIMENIEDVEGLAVDWINRLLYWTTYASSSIEVATLDGMHRSILINTGVEYPRGMAVDPIAGYFFWSDWGAAAAIERSSLNGSNRVPLVTKNITWPNGVTLDTTQRLVYWIDAYHDSVSSVDYDGNNRRLIFEDTSLFLSRFHGFDLDISGDNLYFTDWLANAIYEVQISTGTLVRTMSVPTTRSIEGAMGLRVIHSAKQSTGTSNCGSTNGGCEQLCFHKVPTGTSCGCQIGMKLANDGKSCEDALKDEFVMFADADAGKIYQMQLDSVDVKPVAIPFDPRSVNVIRPVALDHDSRDNRVYWTDVSLHTIGRSFRNGSNYEQLYDDFGVADGLAIDFAAGLLYWTSTTNDTVEASKLDGSNRRTLVKLNLDEPRDIAVDPIGGYMYWTDWGIFPRIERAYMNGENRHDLVNTTIRWPNGLTLDHVYNKLYWVDAFEESIEVIELATLKRKVVLNQKLLIFDYLIGLTTKVNHPYGLTLLHDKLYWTDWSTDAVYRADVNTGANIVLMAGNLGSPMDIHAYSAIPKQEKKIHYTFSFPNTGSNFSCISSTSCPQMDPPPACPPGYTEVRENKTCGLYCQDIVGYTWRCPCNDWMSCAVKERYLWGCASGYYSSFRVRECAQVVRAGRCPSGGTPGSQRSCNGDTNCPNGEKCCNSKCATIATIETHPCRTNNGGCDQLCFSVPGGRKCGCRNGVLYDETLSRCVDSTEPTPTPTPTPSSTGTGSCIPQTAPVHGSINCGGKNPVPASDSCTFSCDSGYVLRGFSVQTCTSAGWNSEAPTCEKRITLICPNDRTVPTDPGKPYATVNWTVPIATDSEGTELPVEILPEVYQPPAILGIGRHNHRLKATDKNGEFENCYFAITVEDREPPSFNSTCPHNIVLYTDNDLDVPLPSTFMRPKATDNAGPPTVHLSGFPADSYFPIGRTVITYRASDAAGLSTTCVFTVTVVNVCRGVTCTFGANCALNTETKSSHVCICNTICPQVYTPVCASDGQEYSNECFMNVQRCATRKNITVVLRGKCGNCTTKSCAHGATCKVVLGVAKCECDFTCTDTRTPVCGSDLNTYDNECKMREAGCLAKKDITVLVRDSCGDCSTKTCDHGATCKVVLGVAKCECDFTCTDTRTPVCGSDLNTYDNECKMREAGCLAKKDITVLVTDSCGDCSTKTCDHGATCKVVLGVAKCECDFTCTDTRTPVCGSDLNTYDNECKMREAGCLAKKDITVLVTDSCGDCSTKTCDHGATCKVVLGVAKCKCDFTCTDTRTPVCGSDLNTYDNECKMREAGCLAKKDITVLVRDSCGDCSTKTCDHGATCKVVLGVAKCECDFTCTDTRTPVCGSDLNTYDNECKMREAGCLAKKDITVLVRDSCGDCSTKTCDHGATCKVVLGVAKCECDFTCTDTRTPVCGTDLKTYDNECKLRQAGCLAKKDITVLVTDSCGDCSTKTCDHGATCKVILGVAKCECDFKCTDTRTPVCGTDLKTYDNECKMREAGCLAKKNITVLVTDSCGDCSTKTCDHGATCKVVLGVAKCECDFTCTDTRTPVCGSDLNTYDNECKMREAGCLAKKDITVLVRDSCGDCSTKTCDHGATCKVVLGVAKCECDFTCTDTRTPVCGTDLKTYDNECKMRETGCLAKKDITVLVADSCGDCSTKTCDHGATCKVVLGVAKCECDFKCTDPRTPVCGSDLKTYDNECKMREAGCLAKKDITVLVTDSCGDCSTKTCDHGATCKVVLGVAKCECNFTCADTRTPVCGSDLNTYDNECKMREIGCRAKQNITVLVEKKCDCDELNLSGENFSKTSKITCKKNTTYNAVECTVSCKAGSKSAIPNFLKLQCYNKQWIRTNKNGKFVPLASASSPPQCYKTKPKNQSCPSGYLLTQQDLCVSCPPGSYKDDAKSTCVPCEVGTYQDHAAQSSCKKCSLGQTSTTTGAENCYFNHGFNDVNMVFEIPELEVVDEEKVRQGIAKGLTNVCKTTKCNFGDDTNRRRKRDTIIYQFQAEHIIILSRKVSENVDTQTEVKVFVLDPSSNSLLPNTAFTSEKLVTMIGNINVNDLPYTLISVHDDNPISIRPTTNKPVTKKPSKKPTIDNKAQKGDEEKSSTSIVPVVAGAAGAVVLLIALALAAWWIMQRRKRNMNGRRTPSVQFNRNSDRISGPVYENPDEFRLGYRNQRYNLQDSPPDYENPSSHVHETPQDETTQDEAPQDETPQGETPQDETPQAVVYTLPSNGVAREKSTQDKPTVGYPHQKNTIPNAYYVPGDRYSGVPDTELRLQPPPRVGTERQASSILPNVLRSTGDVPYYQNVGYASFGQSES